MNIAIADKQNYRRLTIAVLIVCIAIFSYSFVNVFASGLGGYISEKLISSQGTTNSALLIESAGTSHSDLDVTMGPVISVLPAINVIFDGAGTHATVRGTLSNLNGFPTSNVWFEWGYTPAYGSTTPVQIANATGTYSATIDHYIDSNIVYYRFVGQTDGTNYSSGSSFQLSGSGGSPMTASLPLMQIITLVFSAGILLFMLMAISKIESSVLLIIILAMLIFLGIYFIAGLQSLINSIF